MKVGIAAPAYDPGKGGAERYTADLIADLAAAGDDVHVWAAEVPRPGEVPAGVTVHRVAENARGGRGAWKFSIAAWERMAAANCDIVHSVGRTFYHNVYQPHGGTAPATLRANRQAERPGLRPLKWLAGELLSSRWQIYKGIERRAICERRAQPPMVIALSNMVKRDFVEGYRLPEENVRIVYNGVDLERFAPDRARAMRNHTREQVLHVAQDVPVLLMVAHNFKLKGVHHAIEALAGLRDRQLDAVLAICGRGRRRPFEALARRLRVADRIRWLGDQTVMQDFYGAADVFVHPTYYDPCSLVLFEALACGLPAITTRCNGASELMTDGVEGHVLERPDSGELAERCRLLVTDESERKRVGLAARALAETRPRSRNLAEIRAVYQEVLDLGMKPAPPW